MALANLKVSGDPIENFDGWDAQKLTDYLLGIGKKSRVQELASMIKDIEELGARNFRRLTSPGAKRNALVVFATEYPEEFEEFADRFFQERAQQLSSGREVRTLTNAARKAVDFQLLEGIDMRSPALRGDLESAVEEFLLHGRNCEETEITKKLVNIGRKNIHRLVWICFLILSDGKDEPNVGEYSEVKEILDLAEEDDRNLEPNINFILREGIDNIEEVEDERTELLLDLADESLEAFVWTCHACLFKARGKRSRSRQHNRNGWEGRKQRRRDAEALEQVEFDDEGMLGEQRRAEYTGYMQEILPRCSGDDPRRVAQDLLSTLILVERVDQTGEAVITRLIQDDSCTDIDFQNGSDYTITFRMGGKERSAVFSLDGELIEA